ncbi:MAG: sigma-54 dependent transcriptional regulator [Candidatus Sumerlaeaceae bacterium]|nr:sigma-54 dependent transcriptional regulator [Candidatus Sumerlaeaceae bacterium]
MTEVRPKLLVVDDEPDVIFSFRRLLGKEYEILEANSGDEAVKVVEAEDPEVVVMDVRMKGLDGIEALRQIRQISPRTVVILMTAYGTTQSTIEAMKLGAFDYVLKPFEIDHLRQILAHAVRAALDMRRVVRYQRPSEPERWEKDDIVGLSRPMQEVYKLIGRVAPSDLPVLIVGESGTGKELVARAIYQHSNRKEKPFLAINCAAIPDQLLESELFGYERGAFTGAAMPKPGKLEVCDGGTIFLDEIGEMPLATQKKLLRVLESGEIEKVGSTRATRVDVRVIAATNRDLEALVAREEFRSDLYYRLKVVEIRMPPLRERREDIPLLVDYFLEIASRELLREKPQLTSDAMEVLQEYHWPGNVRELENLIKNTLIRHPTRVLNASEIVGQLGSTSVAKPVGDISMAASAEPEVLPGPGLDDVHVRAIFEKIKDSHPLPPGFDTFDLIERRLLELALRHCRGNKSQAARLLGISRNTVRKRVEKYGLQHLVSGEE